jgi:hypothetical protein
VTGPPYPERVLLAPAKAILEVRLLNLESDQRVARTLLQPHSATVATSGPWQPELEPVTADRYQVLQLPPGVYDVYFWVARGSGLPRPYASRELEVPEGRLTQATLDLAGPPDDQEPDW